MYDNYKFIEVYLVSLDLIYNPTSVLLCYAEISFRCIIKVLILNTSQK